MKCIQAIRASKNVEVGDIARINDVDAESRVRGGSHKYIPKSEWRKWKGTTKTETNSNHENDKKLVDTAVNYQAEEGKKKKGKK